MGWEAACMLNHLLEEEDRFVKFVAQEDLRGKEKSWENWATYKAAVFFPYEWLQTFAPYDVFAMGIPFFVPDPKRLLPIYYYSATTRQEWDVIRRTRMLSCPLSQPGGSSRVQTRAEWAGFTWPRRRALTG